MELIRLHLFKLILISVFFFFLSINEVRERERNISQKNLDLN